VYFSGNTIALTFNVGFCAPDSAEFVNYHIRVAAPPNPSITGFTTDPATGGFTLSGNADIAGNVVVWATTSLAPPIDWIAIQTNEVPTGGFSFTVPGTNSQAFYRLMGQ
jgi:hypothetical protein